MRTICESARRYRQRRAQEFEAALHATLRTHGHGALPFCCVRCGDFVPLAYESEVVERRVVCARCRSSKVHGVGSPFSVNTPDENPVWHNVVRAIESL